ncbi:MAG TPA: hypothetical protein VKV38_09170 [Trebonia sp.]|nr:hypothetical protein [Trebonia sp.]
MKATAVRWFPLIRCGYGVALLGVPGLLLRLAGRSRDGRARDAARVLGARQLAQAALTAPRPSATTLALGAEVDLAHALSMLALAVTDRRCRRLGYADAVVATAFAAAGVFAARRVHPAPVLPRAQRPLARVVCLRDAIAARVAALTIPPPIRHELGTLPGRGLEG